MSVARNTLQFKRDSLNLTAGVGGVLLCVVWFACLCWPSAGMTQPAPTVDAQPAPSSQSESKSETSDAEMPDAKATNVKTSQPDDGLTPEERKAIADATAADASAQAEKKKQADSSVVVPVGVPRAQQLGQQASMLPEIALILDVAAAAFSGEPDQLGAHDPTQTGFTLQQLEMHLSSNVDPFFRLDANIVFALFGVEVEEAYATTLDMPGNLQVRAGQFLTRFGRLNATHPHSWDFLDQPLVNGKFFGGEGNRGLGAEVSWLTPLPWFAEIVGSVNNADGACCARSYFGGQAREIDGLEDLLYTVALKQFFELGERSMLLVGMSSQFGPNPTGQGNRTEIYGADLTFRYRPQGSNNRAHFYWQTEAMLRRRQVPFDVLQDLGLYSQMVWQVNQTWATGVRYEYVQGVDSPQETLDPTWTTARQRVALQSTYRPSHFSRMRLQLAWDDIPQRDAPIWAAMFGLEVLIGAHGAHAF